MEGLSPDLFMNQLTYLPFKDVVSLCQTNMKYHRYCTNPEYNTRWKALVKDTFGNVSNFEEKLERIWKELGLEKDTYNYYEESDNLFFFNVPSRLFLHKILQLQFSLQIGIFLPHFLRFR